MIYKKRTKIKESKGISTLLQGHTDRMPSLGQAKKQFLGEAYFFAIVNKTINEIFQFEFPKLVGDLKLCEIFVKHEKNEIKLIIQSEDIGFLTWLKTESECIKEKLELVLVEKKLLKPESEVSIAGKRK
jgi:hypothetical protein